MVDVAEVEALREVEEALAIEGVEAVVVEDLEEAALVVEEEEEGVGAQMRILLGLEGGCHMAHRCNNWRWGGLAVHCRYPLYGSLTFLKTFPCLVALHRSYGLHSNGRYHSPRVSCGFEL